MNPRIYKEYRALAPFWAAALLLPLVPFLLAALISEARDWCCVGYALGCALLGTASFGNEWNHQTMELLLAQPLPRRQLWQEKIRVLALALATVCLAFLVCLVNLPEGLPRLFALPYGWIWIIFPALWALGTGPFFTLCNTNVVVAFISILMTPLGWIAVMILLLPGSWDVDFETAAGYAFCAFAMPLVFLAGVVYKLAKYHFYHLDISRVNSPAIHWLDWVFRSDTVRPLEAASTAEASLLRLVRKEFHLQDVSYLVAGGTLLLTTVLVAARQLAWYLSTFTVEVIQGEAVFIIGLGVTIVGAVLIPLLAGSVAVAEERQMGLWEWHLTLPPSHLRQWLIKLWVTLGHTLALGIALPILASVGLCWLSRTSNNPLPFNLSFLDLLGVGAVSLLVTLISFFASSLVNTSLRAILLGLGVMAMAAVFGSAMAWLFAWKEGYLTTTVTFTLMNLGISKYWILAAVVATALGAILYLSYANYRRLEARFGWLPQILVVSVAAYALSTSPHYYDYFKTQDRLIRDFAGESGLSVQNAVALQRRDPRVIPVLAVMLDNPAQAPKAIECLFSYLRFDQEVLPLFVRALTHSHPEVRITAAYALIEVKNMLLGEPTLMQQAKTALYRNLEASEVKVRTAAMRALISLPVDPEKLVPQLLRVLDEPTTPTALQLEVIGALGNLGAAAQMAVPRLSAIVQEETPANTSKAGDGQAIRTAALVALCRIDPPEKWVSLLLNTATDPKANDETVIRIIDLLGQLGPGAKPAISALSALAKGEDSSIPRSRHEEIRRHATTALYLIDPKSSVIPEGIQTRYGYEVRPRVR